MEHTKPDFERAVQDHIDAIRNRDIEAFKAHMTKDPTMYTIVQNGHAFTTPAEIIAVHEEWFKDPNWIWEGKLVHTVVGEDVAMALITYDYRPKPDDQPVSTWLGRSGCRPSCGYAVIAAWLWPGRSISGTIVMPRSAAYATTSRMSSWV